MAPIAMRFEDFLERLSARVPRTLREVGIGKLPEELRLFGFAQALIDLFERAHIFNLGDGEGIEQAAEEILPDLVAECRGDVPAPFDNMLVFCDTGRGWSCEWHIRAYAYLPPEVAALPQMDRLRILVDLSEPVLESALLQLVAGYVLAPPVEGRPRIIVTPGSIQRARLFLEGHPERAGEQLADDVFRAAVRVALIAHPANYIVRRTPKLTPHEERRKVKGIFPTRKKPHYIVIDHQELLDLNPGTRPTESHRSPTPHARRGHWRRLSDRCRLAKESGKSMIWIGESYVGAKDFEDEKNRYTVLLNRFSQSPVEAAPHGL